MTQHLTDQQLTDIDGHLAAYRQHGPTGFACCSAHPVADAVPELLAEVRRLRTENERMRHELEVMYGGAFDNLPSAAVSAAVAPPTNQTALRDRIAQAIEDAPFRPDERRSLQLADAVLAELPEPTDRAAVLREAADRIEKAADEHPDQYVPQGLYDAADRLRRMADETSTDTPTEVIHACPPDGSGLTPCCGQTPFELPRTDRISSEAPTTCTGPAAGARQDGAES